MERIWQLAPLFAVEVDAYAVMDNHFHLVLHHDPKACEAWSDEEVARRWVEAYPPREAGDVREDRKAEAIELLLDCTDRLAAARQALGSLSGFMKHLKQPIAVRANREDGCKGHFFEQRFYSGALLGQEAVIAAMAYVDLNPVRARIARRAEECAFTSLAERVRENSAGALEEYLAPVLSGIAKSGSGSGRLSAEPDASEAEAHIGVADASDSEGRALRIGLTLREYVDMLRGMAEAEQAHDVPPKAETMRWAARVAAMARPRLAYGTAERLREWFGARGLKVRGDPLPV